MNNLSTLGVITCAIFSVFLSGSSLNIPGSPNTHSEQSAYVVNNSHSVIYYKPESETANPGLNQNGVYEIQPGETLYAPVDAISTSAMEIGKVYRIPTGGTVTVNESGMPEASNFISRAGVLFPSYGTVDSPCESFAMLANSKLVYYHIPDTRL